MDIIHLGHSSFKLGFKNASVVTDPFDSNIGLKFPKTESTIVTVSHDHDDHNKTENVTGVRRVIKGPGEYEVDGISVTGISTYHDDKNGEERGKNTIFVFEAEDLRIAHLGDLGHKLTDKQAERIGDIDILIIPTGGFYTINANQAAEVVALIEPEIVIPMHFKTKGLDESVFSNLESVDEFIKEMGIKTETVKKLSVKSADMTDEDQKIILFEN